MTESIFNAVDLTGEVPGVICGKCCAQGMEHDPSGAVFFYCFHHESGAMRRPGGAWITASHISAKDFKQAVLHAVFAGEQQYIEQHVDGLGGGLRSGN